MGPLVVTLVATSPFQRRTSEALLRHEIRDESCTRRTAPRCSIEQPTILTPSDTAGSMGTAVPGTADLARHFRLPAGSPRRSRLPSSRRRSSSRSWCRSGTVVGSNHRTGWAGVVDVLAGSTVRTVSHWNDRRRDTSLRVVLIGASVLVASSVLMPWATFDTLTASRTAVRPGAIGLVLVALGIGVIGVTGLEWRSSTFGSDFGGRISACVGGAAAAVSVALALRAISRANSFPAAGPSATSYAFGAFVSVGASLTIVVASVLVQASSTSVGQETHIARTDRPRIPADRIGWLKRFSIRASQTATWRKGSQRSDPCARLRNDPHGDDDQRPLVAQASTTIYPAGGSTHSAGQRNQ